MLQNAKKQLFSLKGSVLLGLSGGPDSMCLFRLLLELKKPFQIAHIDHNLQEGSSQISDRLFELAREHNIPFHVLKLDSAISVKANLEEVLRLKRLSFFKDLMEQEELDALMLGHQRDEKAETVLKRLFEGGDLLKLSGIKGESFYEGMKIVRPLLQTSKAQVVSFLENKGFEYFVDPTNWGDGNLRARMRSSLIPQIEDGFGKKIMAPLCDLASQVEDVASYIEREFSKVNRIEGFCGSYLPYEGVDDYIMTHYIYKEFDGLGREHRRDIAESIKKRLRAKTLAIGGRDLCFEVQGVFIIDRSVKIESMAFCGDLEWEEFWKEGDKLGRLTIWEGAEVRQKQLDEYHRVNKIPVCLRKDYPIPLTTIEKKIKMASTYACSST